MRQDSNAARRWKIQRIRGEQNAVPLRYGLLADEQGFDRCVVFLNGRTEWIEKYATLPQELDLPANCAFLTLDHRGQGASGGRRAYIDHYRTYTKDVRKVIEHAIKDTPYVLLAHSMGGLIALCGTLSGTLEPRSMVLGSPLLRLPNQPVRRVIARPAAFAATLAGMGAKSSGAGSFERAPFAENLLTRDSERYQAIVRTPYPIPGPTFGWIKATFQAEDYVFEPERLKRLATPTLLIAGTEEAVVERAGFNEWFAIASKVAKAKIELINIDGGLHELFQELPQYRNQALEATRGWFAEFFASS